MTENQPGLDRILASDDVHVGAADRRRRDPDDRLARPGTGFGTSSTRDLILAVKTTAFMVFMTRSFPCTVGSTIVTWTGMPCRTLSVTVQKSSKSCSHRCAEARRWSSTRE